VSASKRPDSMRTVAKKVRTSEKCALASDGIGTISATEPSRDRLEVDDDGLARTDQRDLGLVDLGLHLNVTGVKQAEDRLRRAHDRALADLLLDAARAVRRIGVDDNPIAKCAHRTVCNHGFDPFQTLALQS
jgi:hypothetical protein